MGSIFGSRLDLTEMRWDECIWIPLPLPLPLPLPDAAAHRTSPVPSLRHTWCRAPKCTKQTRCAVSLVKKDTILLLINQRVHRTYTWFKILSNCTISRSLASEMFYFTLCGKRQRPWTRRLLSNSRGGHMKIMRDRMMKISSWGRRQIEIKTHGRWKEECRV